MDVNEDRTHGEHSAINDEIAAAVPGDMPNAEHKDGDMQLEYSFQQFNALVAANTALQTEVSGAAERVAAHVKHIETLAGVLKDRNGELHEAVVDRDYYRELSVELQRKLDRQGGYLDRVFDQEDTYDAAKVQTVPAAPPAVGPNFDNIPRTVRRSSNNASDFSGYVSDIGARLDVGYGSTARPRRS